MEFTSRSSYYYTLASIVRHSAAAAGKVGAGRAPQFCRSGRMGDDSAACSNHARNSGSLASTRRRIAVLANIGLPPLSSLPPRAAVLGPLSHFQTRVTRWDRHKDRPRRRRRRAAVPLPQFFLVSPRHRSALVPAQPPTREVDSHGRTSGLFPKMPSWVIRRLEPHDFSELLFGLPESPSACWS
jgi:hypothetical protein